MEDKYILNDVLETEKNMVQNMATALNEASCDEIYKTYKEIFDILSNKTKDLFNIAYNKGWYTLEEATKTKVNNEINKLSKELKK